MLAKCMRCKRLKSRSGSHVVSSSEECRLKIGLLFKSVKADCDSTANVVPAHFTRCYEDESLSHAITKVSSDKDDDQVLTPMHFMFPAGYPFTRSSDVLPSTPSSGSMLRRSHDDLRPMVELVWRRWLKEYVPMLQKRSKWLTEEKMLEEGDVVLVVDEIQPREKWSLALVVEVVKSEDGRQRRYKVRTSSGQVLERDIRKLIILERDDEKVVALEGGGEES